MLCVMIMEFAQRVRNARCAALVRLTTPEADDETSNRKFEWMGLSNNSSAMCEYNTLRGDLCMYMFLARHANLHATAELSQTPKCGANLLWRRIRAIRAHSFALTLS